MERLEVKDQHRVFEELPGTLTLDIIMARRQDDKKKKRWEDSILQKTGLWGSGSTGKQAIKPWKTQLKKTRSAAMVKIDIYTLEKKKNCLFKSVNCHNL